MPVKPVYVDPVVAEREQKAVYWSKVLVLLVLSLAIIAVGTATYFFVENGETSTFETQVSLKRKHMPWKCLIGTLQIISATV